MHYIVEDNEVHCIRKFVLHRFDGTDQTHTKDYTEDYAENNLVSWLNETESHREWIDRYASSLTIHKHYEPSEDEDNYIVSATMSESRYAEYLLIFK